MTPSMGMAAPKGAQAPAAPQAGLAALAQPAQAPKGKSPENMSQVMAIARKMSDAQLAEVLQGKSLDVPQYVAMTEAMGRRQLRTAMQGAQAMAQVKQPSIKDKLMAEEAGLSQLAQLPQDTGLQAPVMAAEGGLMYGGGGAIDMNETANSGLAMLPAMNMMPMTMADGGIVAFEEGGDVEARNPLAFLNPGDLYDKLRGYIREKQAAVPMTPLQAQIAAAGEPHPSSAPAPTAAQTAAFMGDVPPSATPAPAIASAPKVQTKKSGLESLLGGGAGSAPTSLDQAKKDYREDYLASLAGLANKQREGIAQLRKEMGGEALMQLAAGILGRPTLQQGLAAGLPLVASTAAAARKEQRDIEKGANEYDLHLAKARAAIQEGDKDRAFQEKKLAEESRLKMAAIGQGTDAMRNALFVSQHPELAHLFPSVSKAGQMSLTDAAKQWNDLPKENRQYYKKLQDMGISNEQDYYRFVNGQLLSATIPGEGATKRPY